MTNKIDFTWVSDQLTCEPCPDCGDEVTIKMDGSSSCSECGHEEVLPCSECMTYNPSDVCDWHQGSCVFTQYMEGKK